MRWVSPDLPERSGRFLVEGLEAACGRAGAGRGWLVLEGGDGRLDLLAAVGPQAPSRRQLSGRLPGGGLRLDRERARPLCPYPDPRPLQVLNLGSGALMVEGARPLPARLREHLSLALDHVAAHREAALLRCQVERLRAELEEARRAPPLRGEVSRDEPLASWHRRAAEAMASCRVKAALTELAKRSAALLSHPFTAVLLLEGRQHQRVRLWGGHSLRRLLGPVFPLRRLGALGRRVLVEGQIYHSSRAGGPASARRLYSKLGLRALVAVPLKVEGRVLGALALGDRRERVYREEELSLIRLMASHCSLLLEGALLSAHIRLEQIVARAVLDSMADGVVTLDWEKRIASLNPAAEAITGWPAREAVGRLCSEVLQPLYPCPDGRGMADCQHACPLIRLLRDPEGMERGLTVEGRIRTRNGEERYVSATYSVVAAGEELLGSVVVLRDITEKKAVEEMKSDYITSISHDLKTPVTAIKGHAMTLLRHGDRLADADRIASLEVINAGCDQITRMFDNLIHLARLEAGQVRSHLEPLELSEAGRRVVQLLAVGSRRHQLQCRIPPGLWVQADRDQLDQVLNNLVSNAVKYSPEGGPVTVEASAEGGWATVRVRDRGPGIPPDRLPELFRPFHRLGGSRAGGTGLGLYITRMLVRSMGGEVGVESEPGRGSTFWFRLPIAEESPAAAE